MNIQSGRVVGYVLFNQKSDRFVGCDHSSGGYPWESDTIQSITIWPEQSRADKYRLTPGFERFNSGQWIVYPLVLA